MLGRGGFGIAYLTDDLIRRDFAVVKELAPAGARRDEGGILQFDGLGAESLHRLRQRFLNEAKVLGRLHVRGVLPVRATFVALGTAFFATEFVADAETLESVLLREGTLSLTGTLDILYQLLEILDGVHRRGILHRDLKPSNILLREGGEAILIDFGAAREWLVDHQGEPGILATPGYAPPEQFDERGRRGPAGDLYALAATALHMLSGSPLERGEPGPWFARRCPDLDPNVAAALDACLSPAFRDRPQSVEELRERLSAQPADESEARLAAFDERKAAMLAFRFGRRECPACGGVLEEPHPLKLGACPVCHQGRIRPREIEARRCPECRVGTLQKLDNADRPAICPCCKRGRLHMRRRLLVKTGRLACDECLAAFETRDGEMTLTEAGTEGGGAAVGTRKPYAEWRAIAGRSEEIQFCDGCGAQLDRQPDGRWRQALPVVKRPLALFPEEWARVAAGLDPGAGNAECESCGADYFLEGDGVTLLAADDDPFRFADRYLGRLLRREDLRWLGVGKQSSHPGWVCGGCGLELDRDAEGLRLVQAEHPVLVRYLDETATLENWHRIARRIPTDDQLPAFEAAFSAAVEREYVEGELAFDGKDLVWRGPATRTADGQSGSLTVDASQVAFGGMLRKWKTAREDLLAVQAIGNLLSLEVRGEEALVELELAPVDFTVHLKSGPRTVTLTAEHLAKRLRQGG